MCVFSVNACVYICMYMYVYVCVCMSMCVSGWGEWCAGR